MSYIEYPQEYADYLDAKSQKLRAQLQALAYTNKLLIVQIRYWRLALKVPQRRPLSKVWLCVLAWLLFLLPVWQDRVQ